MRAGLGANDGGDFDFASGFAVDLDLAEFMLDAHGLAGAESQGLVKIPSNLILRPSVRRRRARGASKSIAAIPAVAPTPRKRLRFAFDTNHLIAFPPKRLRAFAAFPDTWPEAAGEDAHWTDSVRPECADR